MMAAGMSPAPRRVRGFAAAPRRFRPFAALAIAACVAVGGAAGHDFTILPETSHPTPEADFALGMWIAAVFPGEATAWRTGRVMEFAMVDARGRRDIEAPGIGGDPPRARLRLRQPGTAVVALSTDTSYITIEAPEFTAYLQEEGHEAALAARRGSRADTPGRERYTRHVKTVVNAGGPGASVALTRVGLALEIVPEKDLAGLRPGGSLPVRVFFRNAPYANGAICASDAPDLSPNPEAAHDAGAAPGKGKGPYAWCGKLDGAGRASVPIPRAGWQMLRATKMIEVRDDPKADWHSYWTALTFEVAPPEEGK